MKEKIVNPANAVTFVRLIIGLFSVYFVYLGDILGAYLFLAFGLLDIIDGKLARYFNCQTIFGKNFDYFIDLLITGLLSLVLLIIGRIPLLYALLMLPPIAMQIIGTYRGITRLRNTYVSSSWKNYNGIFGSLALLIFMVYGKESSPWVYLILIYFYVWGIKYNLEISNLKSV